MGEKSGFAAKYQLEYEPGELRAIIYKDGTVCGCYELRTVDAEVELFAEECDAVLKADGQDIVFLTVRMRDKRGNINLQEKKEISICVKGEGIHQGYGSADSATEESYKDTVCHIFDGYVQAAIRSGKIAGTVKVTFDAEGCKPLKIAVLCGKVMLRGNITSRQEYSTRAITVVKNILLQTYQNTRRFIIPM